MKTIIIYEDQELLVVQKPAGIATQTRQLGTLDVESELKNHLAKTAKNPYLAVIHRLDQPVEGLLVFAKTKEAASFLSAQLQQQLLHKRYQALLYSTNPNEIEQAGIFEDYLSKDEKGNHSKVVDSKAKDAKKCSLRYEIMERNNALKEKLEVIHRSAETMTDILHSKQSLHLEWYIVLLIVFDIALHIAEKYFGL